VLVVVARRKTEGGAVVDEAGAELQAVRTEIKQIEAGTSKKSGRRIQNLPFNATTDFTPARWRKPGQADDTDWKPPLKIRVNLCNPWLKS